MDKKALAEALINGTITLDDMSKAVKDAKGLEGIRIIKDLWEDYGAIPERNDTKTGPAMHSSGSGADKAMDEYSNPAKQVGITEQYKEFTEKNIEGWGKMHSAFKAMSDEMKAGFGALIATIKSDLLAKSEEEEEKKEEKKEEMHKDPDPDPDPDPKCKSIAEKVASMWSALADLEEACAKAEEHDEKKDIEGLEEARAHIEKAEKELEEVEAHEKEEDASHKAMKAQVSINLGWRSLVKATGLNSYDLHGYGNQEDAQVAGDSTSDQTKKDLKGAKAKAAYFTSKVARMEKSLGIAPLKKDPDPDPKHEDKEEKEEKKEEMHKDPDPDPDPDPKHKAELEKANADLLKMQESMKAMSDRVSFLNKRIEDVSGRKMPPMQPVFIKSAGITSEQAMKALNDRIDVAVEAAEMDEEQADMSRSLVQRYVAAAKGHIGLDKVNMQLERAPIEVQKFFGNLETVLQ